MKKILTLSPSKVLLLCGLGLMLTLGSFWHHQINQSQLNRMNVLNQGVGTCWGRISQTFTAMMIKDVQSSYLARGFMGLSDECLDETMKGFGSFKQTASKGYQTLNKLIGEVHWFHEKVTKVHGPMMANQPNPPSVTPLSDRYSKMENLKVSLIDEVDAASARIRQVQANDEILMGMGLLLFVFGLSILSLQEYNRIQLRREIEKDALNLLKAGQANVGAMVDTLVDRALTTQGMQVTGQIFKDYHGDLLERLASRYSVDRKIDEKAVPQKKIETQTAEVEEEVESAPVPRTSLKEVLVSLQNVHGQDNMQTSDARDVQIEVEFEACEQIMNAAFNKLVQKRTNNKKIMISNQIHSDRTVINLFLSGSHFSAHELEANEGKNISADDMNLMILKELVTESSTTLHLENKADKNGNITGMSIRLTMKRASKEKSKLVSVIRGKKKDLSREMMN